MRRETAIGVYFLVYVALPAVVLHAIALKYPEIGESSIPLYTMIYLVLLFVSSSIGTYTRYSSIPTAISVVATIVYMNYVLSRMDLQVMGASITIEMRNMLLMIYALLALKIFLAVYADYKQKGLSPSAHDVE